MRTETHELYWVRSWDDFLERIKDWHFGVVFIDCQLPENIKNYDRRKMLAQFLRKQADVLVIHDTEFSWFREDEKWQQFVESFLFSWTDKTSNVWTTVLSDKADIGSYVRHGWKEN